jgi:hypothetical protein
MNARLALIGNAVFIANFVNAACLLTMQLWAYRRFRHVSFIVLFVATLAALSSVALFAASGVSSLSEPLRVAAYIWGAGCYFVYMGLGLWGVLSLFRAYGALAEARR